MQADVIRSQVQVVGLLLWLHDEVLLDARWDLTRDSLDVRHSVLVQLPLFTLLFPLLVLLSRRLLHGLSKLRMDLGQREVVRRVSSCGLAAVLDCE